MREAIRIYTFRVSMRVFSLELLGAVDRESHWHDLERPQRSL